MNILGKRIKSLREDKRLNQVELAKMLNISNTTLSQYETGQRIPSDDVKIKLSKIFNVTTDYLLGVTNNIHKEKYKPVDDVEKAMEIILEQPGLMLKGTILSDESKIILANAIQMGLRTAEELEKKKIEGDSNEG